jgi:hypothetical protein
VLAKRIHLRINLSHLGLFAQFLLLELLNQNAALRTESQITLKCR